MSVARSRRRGIGGFLSSIFSNRTESLVGEDRWRRNEWKRTLVSIVIVALGIAIIEGIYRLTHYGDLFRCLSGFNSGSSWSASGDMRLDSSLSAFPCSIRQRPRCHTR